MNYHHIHIKYSGIAGWITSQCKLFDRNFPNKFLCIPSALLSRIIWQNKPRVGPCVQVSPRLSQIELVWFYAFSHKLRMWSLISAYQSRVRLAQQLKCDQRICCWGQMPGLPCDVALPALYANTSQHSICLQISNIPKCILIIHLSAIIRMNTRNTKMPVELIINSKMSLYSAWSRARAQEFIVYDL